MKKRSNDVVCNVMRRDGKSCLIFEGQVRVSKNFSGTKWFVIKDLDEVEMALYKKEEPYVVNEFPVDEYYIIMN